MFNLSANWRCFILSALICLWVVVEGPDSAQARQEHSVYFRDTPYELNVYKIRGRKDGPTMMIVGGIQGDEPGGFLSADLYIDLALKSGNLIVVPRANFNSIINFKRGSNGDMNRKFGRENQGDYDSQIVRILEQLMSESDILLNLHDGWGFYRPRYENEQANPMRYGQSIIADSENFTSEKTGQNLELKKIALAAIKEINSQIDNPQYHFHFMNTRTGDPSSPYAEQKSSATYYALTQHGIPAFGVETSKNLPNIEMKVHQHNLAINAFMKIFGLEPEQPRIYLEKPVLNYLVVAINNQIPVAVADGQTLYVNPGDSIEVVHVEANYERGLSVDIQGLGTINDFRQSHVINKPTFIVAQKDHIKFGRVPVSLSTQSTASSSGGPTGSASSKPASSRDEKGVGFAVTSFLIHVNGEKKVVRPGGTLEAVDGDRLVITDITTQGPLPSSDLVVNFKGFVADQVNNSGEDRGPVINTAKDLLSRYSLSKDEKIYEVVVESGKDVLARMEVKLKPPILDYLVLRHNGGPEKRIPNGGSLDLKDGDLVEVFDLKTNVTANDGVKMRLEGPATENKESKALLSFKTEKNSPLNLIVTREGLTLGKIVFKSI
jgi:hypothetical protein